MMTFLLFAPVSTRWLRWLKTVWHLLWILLSTLFRYVLSVIDTRWSSSRFLNLWTKNHSLSADEVIRCIYLCIYKHFESLPDKKSQICHWKHFARHSFSLIGGIRLSPQTSKTSKSTASLSIAERCTITEIRRQSDSVLTYSLLIDRCLSKFWKRTRTRERE